MSHSKERHEKTCLNCNAELTGRYCHVCGQENIEPKETVWGLVSHFFYDITHFDGKFFSTTKYLITRPGFLPKEYIKGRRASYLHPIRMYVFSSAVFFLIFFSVFKPNKIVHTTKSVDKADKVIDSLRQLDVAQQALLKMARTREDSLAITSNMTNLKEKIDVQAKAKQQEEKEDEEDDAEDRKEDSLNKLKPKLSIGWVDASNHFKTVEAYDSAQLALPKNKRAGWWSRKAAHKNIVVSEMYREDQHKFWEELIEKFMHSFPYLLFISLPLYALILKLLYWRHKQFYYVEHGIFLIYLYIFTFIFLLVYFSVIELRQNTGWGILGWLEGILLLAGTYYTYKAMRKFYLQGRGMTLLKFFLLNMLSFFSLLILFAIFLILTVFQL